MDGETSDLGPIFTICFRGATSLRHFARATLLDAAVLAAMLQLFRRGGAEAARGGHAHHVPR